MKLKDCKIKNKHKNETAEKQMKLQMKASNRKIQTTGTRHIHESIYKSKIQKTRSVLNRSPYHTIAVVLASN